MNKELISVICTVKNAEQTISKTIDSVINQTYPYWELIIVDDDSNDNTKLILGKYEQRDKRIKTYFTSGLGRGKALNKAIELSTGKYVANLDADDLFHPQKLEIQESIFNKNDEIFIIATKSIIIFNNADVVWEEIGGAHELHDIDERILKGNMLNHSSIMMNKRNLENIGRYNEKRKSQLDYELWLRAYNKDLKIIKINTILTAKRIHRNQSFENKRRFMYLFSSTTLQFKYIILKRKYHLIHLPPIRMLFGFLPFNIRREIKKRLDNALDIVK